MLYIKREQSVLKMSPNNPPVAHCQDGDTIVFQTYDCFTNKLENESHVFSNVGWEFINPATGPVYVEGAKAGDMLKVDIIDIQLDNKGVVGCAPNLGVFQGILKEERTRIVPVENGKARFNDKITLEIQPMIGVIGTAPKDQEIPTGTPEAHGGNMDCARIGIGTTLYLPVNIDGAMLAMGDLHAVMGDGEVIGTGIEIAGEVTVKIQVVKGKSYPLPLLIAGGDAITLASAKTLDEAGTMATIHMLQLMVDNGIDEYEAGMLLSLAGNLRVCQVVDPLMTARMELPLWILEQYGIRL